MFLSEGMSSVNARSVSKKLGCSTQPLFSYFPDMSGLRRALIEKGINDFMNVMQAAADTDASVLRRCSAYVRFASEQPRVFLHLLSLEDTDSCPSSILMTVPAETLSYEAEANALPTADAQALCLALNIHAHGLACLIAQGKASPCGEDPASHLRSVYNSLASSQR